MFRSQNLDKALSIQGLRLIFFQTCGGGNFSCCSHSKPKVRPMQSCIGTAQCNAFHSYTNTHIHAHTTIAKHYLKYLPYLINSSCLDTYYRRASFRLCHSCGFVLSCQVWLSKAQLAQSSVTKSGSAKPWLSQAMAGYAMPCHDIA